MALFVRRGIFSYGLVFFLVWASMSATAAGLSAAEQQCLAQLRAEVAFISSRVELIHTEYEQKLNKSGLEQYQSGDYSTIGFLDNSIRKYRLVLLKDLQSYPQRYQQQRGAGRRVCPAEQLRLQAIGMIREFEMHWSKTLTTAQQNADYFQRLEGMR